MKIHRPAAILATLIVASFFVSVIVLAVNTTIVTTPANLHGWQRATSGTGTPGPSVTFVPGPPNPPLGKGSLELRAGAWDNFVGNVDEFLIGVGPDTTTYAFETWSVTGVSPTQNDLNVPKTSDVTAIFDDNPSPATVTQATFTLRGLFTGRYGGTYDTSEPNTARLDPTSDFKAGEVITATASSGIKNNSADTLQPFTWQFWAATTGGSGRFLPHQTVPQFGAEESRGIALGDLDRDGDLDAVVANGGGEVILGARAGKAVTTCVPDSETVWKNGGTGDFTPQVGLGLNCFGAGTDSTDVALGDLNGDGHLDVVVANKLG